MTNGYLVLTRRVGDRTYIDFDGARVEVVVSRLRDGTMHMCFKAPRDVRILREEVAARMEAANERP